jgi:hypothetical protein
VALSFKFLQDHLFTPPRCSQDPPPRIVSDVQSHEEGDYDRMEEMLDDVRHEILTIDSENPGQPTNYEDPATPEVQMFFELLKAA